MPNSATLPELPFEELAILAGRREKLLLANVIRRAAFDIALYKDSRRLKEKRIYIQAHQWMFTERISKDPMDEFASFKNICELLDQDPEQIRRETLKLTRADVRKFGRIC